MNIVYRSILKLNQLLARKKTREINSVIEINGNMKDKVSFITFAFSDVKFTDRDLNVPNAAFLASSIDSESTNIKVTYLYDYGYFKEMNSDLIQKTDFLQVEQFSVIYSIVDENDIEIQSNYQIVYNKDSWSLKVQEQGEDETLFSKVYSFH